MAKKYSEDFLKAYLVLQDMHDTILAGETFNQLLKDRAENIIAELGSWRLTENDAKNKRADIVLTILEQLECNEKLEAKKEELLKNYMRAAINPAV